MGGLWLIGSRSRSRREDWIAACTSPSRSGLSVSPCHSTCPITVNAGLAFVKCRTAVGQSCCSNARTPSMAWGSRVFGMDGYRSSQTILSFGVALPEIDPRRALRGRQIVRGGLQGASVRGEGHFGSADPGQGCPPKSEQRVVARASSEQFRVELERFLMLALRQRLDDLSTVLGCRTPDRHKGSDHERENRDHSPFRPGLRVVREG